VIGTHVCNACNGFVKFVGKRPMNEDGTSHWDICKERQFAKVKAKGVFYRTDKGDEGYIYKGKAYPTLIIGPRIVGSEYKPSADSDVPPWEEI
jgi:hypothetical protein